MLSLQELSTYSWSALTRYFFDTANWKPICMKQHEVEIYSGYYLATSFSNILCVNHGSSVLTFKMPVEGLPRVCSTLDGKQRITAKYAISKGGISANENKLSIQPFRALWTDTKTVYYYILMPQIAKFPVSNNKPYIELPTRPLAYFCPTINGVPDFEKVISCILPVFKRVFNVAHIPDLYDIQPAEFESAHVVYQDTAIVTKRSDIVTLDKKALPNYIDKLIKTGKFNNNIFSEVLTRVLSFREFSQVQPQGTGRFSLMIFGDYPLEVACKCTKNNLSMIFVTTGVKVELPDTKTVMKFIKAACNAKEPSLDSKTMRSISNLSDLADLLPLVKSYGSTPTEFLITGTSDDNEIYNYLRSKSAGIQSAIKWVLERRIPYVFKISDLTSEIEIQNILFRETESVSKLPAVDLLIEFVHKNSSSAYRILVNDIYGTAMVKNVFINGKSVYTEADAERNSPQPPKLYSMMTCLYTLPLLYPLETELYAHITRAIQSVMYRCDKK